MRSSVHNKVWIDPTDNKQAVYIDENNNWCITETYSEISSCHFYSSDSNTTTPDLAKNWYYYDYSDYYDGQWQIVTDNLNFKLSCYGK